jgi:hypothetical protein
MATTYIALPEAVCNRLNSYRAIEIVQFALRVARGVCLCTSRKSSSLRRTRFPDLSGQAPIFSFSRKTSERMSPVGFGDWKSIQHAHRLTTDTRNSSNCGSTFCIFAQKTKRVVEGTPGFRREERLCSALAKKAVSSRNSPNGRFSRPRRNPLPFGSGRMSTQMLHRGTGRTQCQGVLLTLQPPHLCK